MSSEASVVASADRPDLEQARARWREAVAGVLAKSTRREVADLPAEPERLLDTPTYEGFPVRRSTPRWTRSRRRRCPVNWPFTRGGDATRDVLSGWKVAETFPAPGHSVG